MNAANIGNIGTSNSSKGARIVIFMFWLATSAKVYHWQTTKYANHQAAGGLFDDIVKLTDEFVEKFIGVYGRPKFPEGVNIPINDMTKDRMLQTISIAKTFMKGTLQKYVAKDTELQNIRDEMLASLDQASYLLTLE